MIKDSFQGLYLCSPLRKYPFSPNFIREGNTLGNRASSYFFCSEARELTIDQGEQPARTVSLLVPLEAFNGTTADELRNRTSPGTPALVEVSCQVLNMNVYTHANGTISVT